MVRKKPTTSKKVDGEQKMDDSSITLMPVGTTGMTSNPIVVKLMGITIDQFAHRNPGNGPISFNVNGQSTAYRWAVNDEKKVNMPMDQVLYVGDPAGLIAIDALVIESDEDDKDFLERLALLLESFGKIAGLFPATGTAISAGLGIGAAIAKYAASRVEDDLELAFAGSIGSPSAETVPTPEQGGEKIDFKAPTGKYALVKKGTNGDAIRLDMEIVDLGDIDAIPANEEVVVFLDAITFKLENQSYNPRDKLIIATSVGLGPEPTTWKLELNGLPNRKDIHHTVGFHAKPIYRGPMGLALPVSLSINCFPEDMTTGIDEIVTAATTLAVTLEPEDEETINKIGTISQTVTSLVGAFMPQTIFGATVNQVLTKNPDKDLVAKTDKGDTVQFKIRLVKTGKTYQPKKPQAVKILDDPAVNVKIVP